MSDSCIFCRIVRGEIPAKIVAERDLALAFRDRDPQAPIHVLVITRRHVTSLADADNGAELGAMLLLAAQVAFAEGISKSGYRTVLNTGGDGGQSVDHLHAHVLGGRAMHWPPG